MKKVFFILYSILLFSIDTSGQIVPTLYKQADEIRMNHWVDSVMKTLSPDEKLGQLLMVIADPKTNNRNIQLVKRYITEFKIGGVLFHRGNPAAQAEVTNLVQSLSKVPAFIALDGEWGLSMRLSGTTRFPKNMMLGAIENNQLIEAYGKEVARQCKEMGIQINFAPSLDVNCNYKNPVIGLRSFGENPDMVTEKGLLYSKGLEESGVISVAKHFPGHGDTSDDSHHTLPILGHDRQRLDSVELFPFDQYIKAGYAGVMTGHLYVPALDNSRKQSSTYSSKIVTDLLHEELAFDGLRFTDALAMGGGSTAKEESSYVLALNAGNDILLITGPKVSEIEVLRQAVNDGTVSKDEIEKKCRKVLQYKYITGLNKQKPIEIKGLTERLNSAHAQWLASKLNEESLTLLKNEADMLPLKELDKKKIAVLSLGEGMSSPFVQTLKKYTTVDSYSILRNTKANDANSVYKELENYDLVICAVHTVRIPESKQLQQLAKEKGFIFVFFTLPYFCNEYKISVTASDALVMAYEATPLAQKFAAQLVFGGIGARGKLPVTIPDLYFSGSGIFTAKTRLGCHEPEEVGLNSEVLASISTIAQEGITEKAYPGCQVLVAKNGMIVYSQSFGHYDYSLKEKVSDESVYDLASVSKATGTLPAVMKAYEEKLFTLNQRIADFIHELKDSNKRNVKIADMLYHQSGIVPTISFYLSAIDKESYSGSLFSARKDAAHPVRLDARTYVRTNYQFLPEAISTTSKKGFTRKVANDLFVSDSFQDSILYKIADSKLRTPGRYAYSCVNFILLKMMVEKQLGRSLDQFMDQTFFQKLGMKYSGYNPHEFLDSTLIVPTEDDQFLRKQLLRGYVHDEAAAFQGGVSGNAGMFSNANDLAKELQMLLNHGEYGGERYVSKATCRLFTESKSPTCRRGLGFDKPDTSNPQSSPCGELAPASIYGHTGFTGTCFWNDPDNQIVYIFLSNRVTPTRVNNKLSSLNIRTRIQDAIYLSMQEYDKEHIRIAPLPLPKL